MRPIRILVIYLAFVFLGAALIAPWIYEAVQLIGQHALGDIAKQPFHRYVNRALIILALAGLWPFLRALGIRSWQDLGFAPIHLHWKGRPWVSSGCGTRGCNVDEFLIDTSLWPTPWMRQIGKCAGSVRSGHGRRRSGHRFAVRVFSELS